MILQGKNYLTINFLGGLGNLMFEYASLYGLAVQNHMRPYVPEDSAINQHFNVTKHIGHPLVTSQTRWEPLAEYRPSAFDRNMLSLNYEMNISIVGFLQSWRYFQNVSSDIRKHFQFPKEVQFTAESLLLDAFRAHASKSESRSKQVEYVTYIGVHVRRGDYVSEEYNERRGYTVADIEYLDRAIGYYESRYRNIIFVVCSDDIKWSMFNFRPRNSPVVFSEGHTALEDMAILAACNHTIATVGTFGWWAGWLAGGDVVYYKHFPRPGSVLADHMNKEDYYPKGWVGL